MQSKRIHNNIQTQTHTHTLYVYVYIICMPPAYMSVCVYVCVCAYVHNIYTVSWIYIIYIIYMYICMCVWSCFFSNSVGKSKNTNLKFSKQKSTLKTISLVMLSYWFKSWVLKHLTNLKQVSTLTSYQPCFPWTWAFSPTKQCIAVAHAPPSWTQANPAPESNGPRKGCSHRASAAVVRFHFGEGGLRGVDLEPEQAALFSLR